MAVRYNGPEGTREFKLRVKPGPEGLAMFKAHLKEILGFDVGSEFDVTFECQMPATGSMLTLSGLNAYGAATHCAALLASSKTGTAAGSAATSSQQQQAQHSSASAMAASATPSRSAQASAAAALGAPVPLHPLRGTQQHQPQGAQCISPVLYHSYTNHQHQQSPAVSLPCLTPFQRAQPNPQGTTASELVVPRRPCQTGYVHHYFHQGPGGCRRSAPPTAPAAATPSAAALARRSNAPAGSAAAGGASWHTADSRRRTYDPRATLGSNRRASSETAAQDVRGDRADDEYDIDDLLPYSRRDVVPEPISVMPPVDTAAVGSEQGRLQADPSRGDLGSRGSAQQQHMTTTAAEHARQASSQVQQLQLGTGGGAMLLRPLSSPNGPVGGRTRAMGPDATVSEVVSPTPCAGGRQPSAKPSGLAPSEDRKAIPSYRSAGAMLPPANPLAGAAAGMDGAAAARATAAIVASQTRQHQTITCVGAGAAAITAPSASSVRHLPPTPMDWAVRCPQPQEHESPYVPQLPDVMRAGEAAHGRLHLPEVIKSTARRTVGSLLRALRQATK